MGSQRPLGWCYLGRVDYGVALALQERLRDALLRGAGTDTLLLLEHPPVITLGRSARPENVLVDDAGLARLGIALHRTSRGGDVTYHGPGQLVGYPVRLVGRAVEEHVRGMADALVAVLGELGIDARWSAEAPGVYTDRGKIAAIGVDARGGVAIHGFALNVSTDLSAFSHINPCGSPLARVTSVAAFAAEGAAPTLEEMARRVARELLARFGAASGDLPPPLDARVLLLPPGDAA
jgi:lipoyl(octanoyl) transferase